MQTKTLQLVSASLSVKQAYISQRLGFRRGKGYTPDDVVVDVTFTDGRVRYYGKVKCGTYFAIYGTTWSKISYNITKPIIREISEIYEASDPDSEWRKFEGRHARAELVIAPGDILRVRAHFEHKTSKRGNEYFKISRIKFI